MKRAGVFALSLLSAGALLTGCASPDAVCNTGEASAAAAMDHLIESTLAGNQIEVCRVTTIGGTDTVGLQFGRLADELGDLGVDAGYTVKPVEDSTLGGWSQLVLSTPSHPEGKPFDVFERGGKYTIGWLEFVQDPLPGQSPAK
ncbi:hypothetical protein [Paeniglutamicibacter kerguelensis]|uniref:Lipoprotein n=1 Tax=Paeniglutamicibacter kerguelensis TaxID=254788 RepID=A0ABS4XIM0_9MICC|nr:hypothetical protein [Paeniglutamicibacter kerguelensis]MBP2388317.1 hypothetical protein [Paeniglutamicibacter kerguelensis]